MSEHREYDPADPFAEFAGRQDAAFKRAPLNGGAWDVVYRRAYDAAIARRGSA